MEKIKNAELPKVRFKQDNSDKSDKTIKNISNDKVSDKGILEGKKVLVYIPSYLGMHDSNAVESLIYILSDCWEWKAKGWQFFPVIGKRMFIQNARGLAVKHAKEIGADYILFIDDDMTIRIGDKLFSRLVSHNKDIVAPLFFQRRPPYLPLLFYRNSKAGGKYNTYDNILDYPKDNLVKVDGIGLGCALIKMSVFDKIDKPYFFYGDTFGEDLYFCEKCINKGIEIYVDTSIKMGHIGDPIVSTEDTFIQNRKPAEEFVRQKKENDEKESQKFINKVDVVMPAYAGAKNCLEITKDAIESILNFTQNVDLKIIVINDGKHKGLEKYLKNLKKVRGDIDFIANPEPLGWTKAVNQGLKKCTSPYILICNNDIEIPEGSFNWLDIMIASLFKDKKTGAVSPVSDYVMGFQKVELNQSILLTEHYAKFLIGMAILVKKEVIDKIGGLDERFSSSGNDDLDYSIRIRQAGYRLKIIRNVFIKHKGSQSLKAKFSDIRKEDKKSRKILIDKWGKEKVDELFTMDNKFLINGD